MVNEDSRQSPEIPKEMRSGHKWDCILVSPRFKSAAAMAGWDEEALLLAFEDDSTPPGKPLMSKKRSSDSTRKRKTTLKRNSDAAAMPAVILDLDDEIEGDHADSEKKEKTSCTSNSSVVPCCIDRLREELSCAICLEICFEPSTTTCGHSFCKKCLESAADKCGKRCPKCRQHFISSNGRKCSLNTVLWNTIQLLFPQEVEDRKKAVIDEQNHQQHQAPPATAIRHDNNNNYRNGGGGYNRNRTVEALNSPDDDQQQRRRRRRTPSQDEDAALALRLQRQEFMEASRQEQQQQQQQRRRTSSSSTQLINLRAIASRAVSIRHLRRNNNNRQT